MIVVRWIRAFVDFWIDFVVGDDWTVAATVLAALLVTWGLQRAAFPAWAATSPEERSKYLSRLHDALARTLSNTDYEDESHTPPALAGPSIETLRLPAFCWA